MRNYKNYLIIKKKNEIFFQNFFFNESKKYLFNVKKIDIFYLKKKFIDIKFIESKIYIFYGNCLLIFFKLIPICRIKINKFDINKVLLDKTNLIIWYKNSKIFHYDPSSLKIRYVFFYNKDVIDINFLYREESCNLLIISKIKNIFEFIDLNTNSILFTIIIKNNNGREKFHFLNENNFLFSILNYLCIGKKKKNGNFKILAKKFKPKTNYLLFYNSFIFQFSTQKILSRNLIDSKILLMSKKFFISIILFCKKTAVVSITSKKLCKNIFSEKKLIAELFIKIKQKFLKSKIYNNQTISFYLKKNNQNCNFLMKMYFNHHHKKFKNNFRNFLLNILRKIKTLLNKNNLILKNFYCQILSKQKDSYMFVFIFYNFTQPIFFFGKNQYLQNLIIKKNIYSNVTKKIVSFKFYKIIKTFVVVYEDNSIYLFKYSKILDLILFTNHSIFHGNNCIIKEFDILPSKKLLLLFCSCSILSLYTFYELKKIRSKKFNVLMDNSVYNSINNIYYLNKKNLSINISDFNLKIENTNEYLNMKNDYLFSNKNYFLLHEFNMKYFTLCHIINKDYLKFFCNKSHNIFNDYKYFIINLLDKYKKIINSISKIKKFIFKTKLKFNNCNFKCRFNLHKHF
ncbi:hypothetical protein (nucleomorph) [Guillardia theta]|uniref:Uncharacterized protein n=1 Tax=Guillardia theta TaxID=55529 RepID=Q98S73_GUITH|nr:hypothetical protein GTHECHR3065 [Guillardia theta]AAK39709.1 hypothetical protein [Guillardia theta]